MKFEGLALTPPMGWSFNKIIDHTSYLYSYAGPGHWNDPDMLIVGLHGNPEWMAPDVPTLSTVPISAYGAFWRLRC